MVWGRREPRAAAVLVKPAGSLNQDCAPGTPIRRKPSRAAHFLAWIERTLKEDNLMARTDWCAAVCNPTNEYLAVTELERLGLRPYLPQRRRQWRSPVSIRPCARLFPLFPGYVLLPVNDAHSPAVRMARGLRRVKPILASE